MTVFFTSDAVADLPISSEAPYMVAISSSGIFVGSASFASEDLLGGQQSLAVWGDDTGTPEFDGASEVKIYIFNLLMDIHYMMFQWLQLWVLL